MTSKEKTKRLQRIRDDIKRLGGGDCQRMLIELSVEGMRDENIANDLNTTGESVRKWKKGAPPSPTNADLIRELHAHVMFLKERGITFAILRSQKKTIAQAYNEEKENAA